MSIVVDSLVKYYGTQKVLKEASFHIDRGQVVGLLGPNGAGKSTMMKILVGLLPPTSGKAFVNDMDVETQSLAVRRIVGYLPEHNPLYLDMYVQEYLQMTALMYGLKNVSNRVKEVIGLTGITPERQKKIGQLSKGFRQRVGLAQTLLHNPDVLVLDEPTTGLDPNQIVDIRSLIRQIGQEKTVILSTHIMQEVEAVCSRAIIINQGSIVANEPIGVLKMHTSSQVVEIEFVESVDMNIFANQTFISDVTPLSPSRFLLQSAVNDDIRPFLFRLAVEKNLTIILLRQKEMHLEDIFRQLTLKN